MESSNRPPNLRVHPERCDESNGWIVYRGEQHIATFAEEADAREYVRLVDETAGANEGTQTDIECHKRLADATRIMRAVAIHIQGNWRAIDGAFLYHLQEFLGQDFGASEKTGSR